MTFIVEISFEKPPSTSQWLQYLLHKAYMATALIRKRPLQECRRAIGIGLLQGPRRVRFLLSEVPLYPGHIPAPL